MNVKWMRCDDMKTGKKLQKKSTRWHILWTMSYPHSVYSALPSAQAFCGNLVTSPIFHFRYTPFNGLTVLH
ncbi:hypothetical protein KQX54_001764 [Cotesia glomerata]|uniref:Uncharacterized protein n=1 Tax=Cotesia glomerata TaxID=32391 RepID=A0AAV7IWK2_COTGL|nr:hypothetical protein KQX54_001764 [Cotesia glomerata]